MICCLPNIVNRGRNDSPETQSVNEEDGFLATLLICRFFSVVNTVVEAYAFSVTRICRYRGGRCLFSNPCSSSVAFLAVMEVYNWALSLWGEGQVLSHPLHEVSRIALVCVPMCPCLNGQYWRGVWAVPATGISLILININKLNTAQKIWKTVICNSWLNSVIKKASCINTLAQWCNHVLWISPKFYLLFICLHACMHHVACFVPVFKNSIH